MKVQAKVHDDAGDVSNTCDFQLTEDFFFFQSSMQHAGLIHLSGMLGKIVDKVERILHAPQRRSAHS